ncbi:caspase family protein [Herpetosiphon gulosus]|uniref:Peptidase C14 caspase domain-containing protein n=1 Tax=Herpetosiphon gulosus TaxID=1973496 RepID=A0ABP9WWV5_9CHLR
MNVRNNLALLIGVGKNKTESFKPLPVQNDIEALKSALSDRDVGGYQPEAIQCLVDQQATIPAIERQLIWLAEQAQAEPDATIFIYYSGHGAYDDHDRYYLINYEATTDLAASAFSAQRLMELLKNINSQRVVIVFDCCYAAGLARGKGLNGTLEFGNPSKALVSQFGQGSGVVVIASSQPHEESFFDYDSVSIFTKAFLSLLYGYNAPADATEVMIGHVIDTLPKMLAHTNQTPEIAFHGQSFSLAKLLGGKGLGAGGWQGYQAQAEASIQDLIARSQVTNVQIQNPINAHNVQQDSSQHTTTNHGMNFGGASFGNNTEITSGDSYKSTISIGGRSTVNGPVVGINRDTINYTYSSQPSTAIDLKNLDLLEKQLSGLVQTYSHNPALADQLQMIAIHLRKAQRNQAEQAQAELAKAKAVALEIQSDDPTLLGLLQTFHNL